MQEFENFDHDPEEYLRYCWIAISTHIDKPAALWYAVNGHKYLDSQQIDASDEQEMLDELYRKGMGYQIVATAYAWNDRFDEAFLLEQHFMSHPYWLPFKEYIGNYMVMLIAKQQAAHLNAIFKDAEFKYAFLPWWEAYMSLLVDDNTTITRMNETVPIINQANTAIRIYGS